MGRTNSAPPPGLGALIGERRRRGAAPATNRRLVSGLVLGDLYLRGRVDPYHVRALVEALKARSELPPVVVERGSGRVVDGFHRVTAYRQHYGREALIYVLEKDYESDADLFLDQVRLNSAHGKRLASFDQARALEIAERFEIDRDTIAKALSLRPETATELKKARFAREMETNSPLALKRTIQHMRGRRLTKTQLEANHKLGGQSQSFYAYQLLLLLENGLLDTNDETLMRHLARVKDLLGTVDTSGAERRA